MRWEALLEAAAADGLVETSRLGEPESSAGRSRQVSRWAASGRLTKLRRGLYVVNAPYRSRAPHPFRIAARLLAPSYVSLHAALAFHGLTTARSRSVTSVTTRRTARFETPLGRFSFQVVREGLFEGFREQELPDGQVAHVASPEKALLDLIYLEPPATLSQRLAELEVRRAGTLSWSRVVAMADELGIRRISEALRRL